MYSSRSRHTVKKSSSKKRKKKKAIERFESELQVIKDLLKEIRSLHPAQGGLSNNYYTRDEDHVTLENDDAKVDINERRKWCQLATSYSGNIPNPGK